MKYQLTFLLTTIFQMENAFLYDIKEGTLHQAI